MAVTAKTTAYPEHEKLKEVQIESNACGNFLEWLVEQEIYLAKYNEQGVLRPLRKSINELLEEHFGIDQKKLEEEKQAILKALR